MKKTTVITVFSQFILAETMTEKIAKGLLQLETIPGPEGLGIQDGMLIANLTSPISQEESIQLSERIEFHVELMYLESGRL